MRKITFLLLGIIFTTSMASAEVFENLYVVGNACDAGWSPEKSLQMTKEADGVFIWMGTLQDNTGDGGQRRFKFLTDNTKWEPSVTCRINVPGHLMVDMDEEYDLFVRYSDGEDNAFQVAETAEYTIYVNLNTMKMIVAKTGDVEPPTVDMNELYLIGSATTAGWDNQNPIEMTKLEEGVFTWTGELSMEQGDEFKFLNEKDTWDKTINAVEENTAFVVGQQYDLHFRPFESSPNDFKFKLTTVGSYTITVDLNSMKMTVTEGENSGIDNVNVSLSDNILFDGNSIIVQPNGESILNVGLYDTVGRCLHLITNVNHSVVLGENLIGGVYIVKVKYDKQELTQKIMIINK